MLYGGPKISARHHSDQSLGLSQGMARGRAYWAHGRKSRHHSEQSLGPAQAMGADVGQFIIIVLYYYIITLLLHYYIIALLYYYISILFYYFLIRDGVENHNFLDDFPASKLLLENSVLG